MGIEEQINDVVASMPDSVTSVMDQAVEYIPSAFRIGTLLKFILVLIAVTLLVGIVTRLILGRRSSLNRSISAAVGILCVYIISVCIYCFQPAYLSNLLAPLPFVSFRGNYLRLLPFTDASFAVICTRIMAMIILAFLVNLADSIVPVGENVVGWLFSRVFMVIFAMVLHLVMNWALNKYLPDFIVTYAPVLVLILLVSFLLIGLAKIVLGIVLAVINPFIGAVYAFFFSNMIGKQVTKAVLSTILMCLFFYLLEYFGCAVINITPTALLSYSPLVLTLLVLWYLLGHEL